MLGNGVVFVVIVVAVVEMMVLGVDCRGGGGSGRLFILELSYFSLPTTPTQKPTEFA